MKKIVFILSVVALCCCGGNKKSEPIVPVVIHQDDGQVTYKYKVEGLQDSIISDSIWRVIFQVQGIDKMVLSKEDCTAVFTVDPKLVTDDILQEEIAGRGGKLRNFQ